ncbi:MAG TPA: hypothetical protein DDW30_09605 [Clostridiales bacterium]|nr:hypothetical protein [Clostridiales bacterium]
MKSMSLSRIVIILVAILAVILFAGAQVAVALLAGLSASFWVSCGFFAVGLCVVIGFSVSAMRRHTALFDVLLRIPLWKHCVAYAIVEFVLAVLFSALGQYVHCAVAAVVQLVALIVYLACAISALIPGKVIGEIRKEVKQKTTSLRLLQVNAQMLADACTDPAAKKEAAALAEAIRFSDPMSHACLEPLEADISSAIRTAREECAAGNTEAVLAACRKASSLLSERNMKCKVLK